VPADPDEWIVHSPEELVLRHCAFWRSLYDQPDLPGDQASTTVTLPKDNLFNVEGLKEIVKRIGDGVKDL
jgi:hypothetical protein